METTQGELQIVVSSKKVLARVENFEVSTRMWNGQVLTSRKTINIYDHVFDDTQTRALNQARQLAYESGLALEVIDLSRRGIIGRILGLGTRTAKLRPMKVKPNQLDLRVPLRQGERKKDDVSLVACQP